MAEARPKVRPDLDVVELDGEAVVYDARSAELHYLNHTAALVFGLCDGAATTREIAEMIAEVYEMPEDEVETHVRALVKGLRGKGLLARARAAAPVQESTEDTRALVRLAVPDSG